MVYLYQRFHSSCSQRTLTQTWHPLWPVTPFSPRSLILSHTSSAIWSECIRAACVCGRVVTSQLHRCQSGQTTQRKHGKFQRWSGREQGARTSILFQNKIQHFLLSFTISLFWLLSFPFLPTLIYWGQLDRTVTLVRSTFISGSPHLTLQTSPCVGSFGRYLAHRRIIARKPTRKERGRGNKRKIHEGTWINKSSLRRKDRWPGGEITVQIIEKISLEIKNKN